MRQREGVWKKWKREGGQKRWGEVREETKVDKSFLLRMHFTYSFTSQNHSQAVHRTYSPILPTGPIIT